jgi:choline-glycine betaine transporter
MAMKPPLRDLPIETASDGFYEGFNTFVTVGSKVLIGLLIIWAAVWSESAGDVLNAVRATIDANTGAWYMYVMTFFIMICLVLAVTPSIGRTKLGLPDDKPEFSSFSWFSMMFGAGIGIGMLTYATAEPIYHFGTNPDAIMGLTTGSLGSSFKCNTQSPLGIGCCDGHTNQAPQQRGPWRDISRA